MSSQFRSSQNKSCWGRSNQVMTGQSKLGLVQLDRSMVKMENFPDFYFWTQHFFGGKFFLAKKLFWPKNFLEVNFFGPKNVFTPKSFWTQNALEIGVWLWSWPILFLFILMSLMWLYSLLLMTSNSVLVNKCSAWVWNDFVEFVWVRMGWVKLMKIGISRQRSYQILSLSEKDEKIKIAIKRRHQT